MTEQETDLAPVVELLENRLADAVLALDNIGWSPLGMDLNNEEVPLSTIKEVADTTRALVAINPLVKRGVGVRTQYVHGKGMVFKGIEVDDPIIKHPLNQKFLFSSEADAEKERCLATDGNFFYLAYNKEPRRAIGRPRKNTVEQVPTGMRIPLAQITGIVTNPDNPEEIWFYRREYSVTTHLKTSDKSTQVDKIEYYPSDLYSPEQYGKPDKIRGKVVRWDGAIIEHSVNKQVGWRWGLPDAMAIIFWAKAHKEFLEDCAKLIKAYSRFAWKATAATPNGVKQVATSVAAQPQRDHNGQVMDIGATAAMSAGSNLQAVGRTSGSVDFSAGIPLAGYVAAGLEIPLTDLLADSSLSNRSSAETLSDSKLASMVARQKSWTSFYSRLFAYWGKDVEVTFPRIDSEPMHRRVAAITQAAGLNVLHDEEVRTLLLLALDLDSEKGMPTEEELGLMILAIQKAEEQADKAAQAAAEKPDYAQDSYGDNSSREEIGQHEYTHGEDGR